MRPVTNLAVTTAGCVLAIYGLFRPPLVCGADDGAAATRPADAAVLYREAAQAIVAESPRESNLEYPNYPPFGAAWDQLAESAWLKNAATRELARRARSVEQAKWPKGIAFLNEFKRVANQLADAAMYRHLKGEDAEAIEFIRDLLHISKLLRNDLRADDDTALVRLLVAIGIDALAMDDLLTIVPGAGLTSDPADHRAIQVADARRLIGELLDQQVPEDLLKHMYGATWNAIKTVEAKAIQATIERFNRANAERAFGAMSLACHLFNKDKGRWPRNLPEFVPAYIERIPIDPWGDGKETLGYALVEGGLPDGSDRPLVFSRAESRDGLFFRIDTPQYGWYIGDGSDKPFAIQKKGGQFRDVARWVPKDVNRRKEAVRPLSSIERTR